MDRNHLFGLTQPEPQCRVATLHLTDGNAFEISLSEGCEQFVGRFAMLAELRPATPIIRFSDLQAGDSEPLG